MGEHAQYKGQQIKIGTCEDMYYLRYDQRHSVTPERHSLDPVTEAPNLRFRFPWPSEDGIEPGCFDSAYKRVGIYGFAAPTDVEHGTVQFVAQTGYNVSLPCPESTAYETREGGHVRWNPGLRIHRNGCGAPVSLVAQKYVPSIGLVPILVCTACGTMWREEERSRIEELAACFRSAGDQREREGSNSEFWHTVADRILAGLNKPETVASVAVAGA